MFVRLGCVRAEKVNNTMALLFLGSFVLSLKSKLVAGIMNMLAL